MLGAVAAEAAPMAAALRAGRTLDAFPHLLTPSHTFPHLLTPSHTFYGRRTLVLIPGGSDECMYSGCKDCERLVPSHAHTLTTITHPLAHTHSLIHSHARVHVLGAQGL